MLHTAAAATCSRLSERFMVTRSLFVRLAVYKHTYRSLQAVPYSTRTDPPNLSHQARASEGSMCETIE